MAASSFIIVDWNHKNAHAPIMLVSEIDAARFEIRRVELYTDGRMTRIGSPIGSPEAQVLQDPRLSDQPLPPLKEISTVDDLHGVEISKAEFESMWSTASDETL